MATLQQPAAEGGHELHLSPKAAAILREMAQTAYLLDRYREGIAAKSRRLAQLQAELRQLGLRP